jgi:hypothetical protein
MTCYLCDKPAVTYLCRDCHAALFRIGLQRLIDETLWHESERRKLEET